MLGKQLIYTSFNRSLFKGGSAWTKKYKPITVHELRPDCSDNDEQIITQEYMKKYGIENA